MTTSYKVYTSYGIRVAQAVFSIITFALAAKVVTNSFKSGPSGYNVAVGVITLVWLVVLFVPLLSTGIPLVGILIGEFILWVFWLAAFASMANHYWGSISCSVFDNLDSYYGTTFKTTCHAGKGVLAFGVLNWVLFSVSLGLLIFFAVVPAVKAKTLTKIGPNGLTYGSIFPTYAGSTDPEASIIPETKETEPGLAEPVEPTIGVQDSEPIKAVESEESPIDPTVK